MEVEGIVISNNQFRDQDAIITILTKDNILSFLAKGVGKVTSKNSTRVAPFTRTIFSLMKTETGLSLKNGKIISSYEKCKSSFENLAILNFVSEITHKLIVNVDAKGLYNSLETILEMLNNDFDPFTLLIVYFAKVLRIAGVGLNVHKCQICGKTHDFVGVSYRSGGFVCDKCFDHQMHLKCTERKMKILKYIFMVEYKDYSRVSFQKQECLEIFNELIAFTQNIFQVEIKSAKLFETLY